MTTHGRYPALFLMFVSAGFVFAGFVSSVRAEKSPPHDRQFWRDIARHSYAVPEDASAFALAQELSTLFASPDPELRDDLSYSILAHWIAENKLSAPELISLQGEWRANLKSRIGESGTDSVLQRSFSALCLAELAAHDLKTPFLGADRYRILLTDALAYLNQERDLRGYDTKLGWIHATAHTADLLRALAMNALLAKGDQAVILAAISERLASAGIVYTHGEQDRLARAAAAIVEHTEFDANAFNAWLRTMSDRDRAMWSQSPIPLDDMARYQNDSYLLEALGARLAGSGGPTRPAPVQHALDTILAAVRER
jgi:hypothetical protein